MVTSLVDVRDPDFSATISIADLWVLAASIAIRYASTPGQSPDPFLEPSPGPLDLPFRFGRVDAATCHDAGFLPDADFKWDQIKDIFVGRLGMDVNETVAILGAHSLGRAEWSNSGYDGGWSAYQSSFSNQYYKNFGISRWDNRNDSSVWVAGSTMMLQADAELLYNTNAGAGLPVYCDSFTKLLESSRCPMQLETNAAFMAYAAQGSIGLFYSAFARGWKKMTEYPYSEGQLVAVS